MTDREAVYALARSFLDWLPGPKISRYDPSRVEAPSERKPCPGCSGEGRRRVRGIWQPCDRCHGTGRLLVDGYTGREITHQPELPLSQELERHFALQAADPATRGALREAERQRNLREELRLTPSEGDEPTEDWFLQALDRRDKQFASGSYPELEQAQRRLEHVDQARWRLWWQLVLVPQPVLISTLARRELDGTADLLASWMPRPLRLPVELRPNGAAKRALQFGRQHTHLRARAERDKLVLELAREGLSSGQIALHPLVAVSAGRVRQILVGLTPVTVATAA